MIYDAEDKPDPDQSEEGDRRVPERRRADGLRAGGAELLERGRELPDPDVHPRVLVLVRLHAARARPRWTCRSRSAARPTTSAPRRCDLGGWDPFNVTEDADLGIRARALGYSGRRRQLDHVRGGEQRTRNWIRQRSRWIKGYMQTSLVHSRHPGGWCAPPACAQTLGFALLIGGTPLTFLIAPAAVGRVRRDR